MLNKRRAVIEKESNTSAAASLVLLIAILIVAHVRTEVVSVMKEIDNYKKTAQGQKITWGVVTAKDAYTFHYICSEDYKKALSEHLVMILNASKGAVARIDNGVSCIIRVSLSK